MITIIKILLLIAFSYELIIRIWNCTRKQQKAIYIIYLTLIGLWALIQKIEGLK